MSGRSWTMMVVGVVSLVVAVFGLTGSVIMVGDGLGIVFKDGGMTASPGVNMPYGNEAGRVVAICGAIRGILSMLLVFGAIGTIYVRPSGRDLSLCYAIGWIVMGGIEPLVLHYRFGWQVMASSGYAFGLLLVFNTPAWREAFRPYRANGM